MDQTVLNRDAILDLKNVHLRLDKDVIYQKMAPAQFGKHDDVAYIFDGNLITKILKSRDFDVLSPVAAYKKLEDHTGLDFGAVTTSMDAMPLFVDGERHRELRAEMAKIMGKDRPLQSKVLASKADSIFSNYVRPNGAIDFVTDLTLPLYHALTKVLVGVDWTETFLSDDYPRLLDPVQSLNSRKALNASLVEALDRHKDDGVSAETIMALVMLGHDTFVGAIALSLWLTIEHNQGKMLSEIDWPMTLPATSAPFVDRVAARDCEIAGYKISKGKRLRMVLDAISEYGPLEQHDLIFGKGVHSCIGRSISENSWKMLTEKLSSFDMYARASSLEIRKPDSVFYYPIVSKVEFYE